MPITRIATVAAAKALLNPDPAGLYYIAETNCFYSYDPAGVGTNDDELIIDPTTAPGRFFATKAGAFA